MNDLFVDMDNFKMRSKEHYDMEQDTASLLSFSEIAMQKSLQASIPPQSPDDMTAKLNIGKWFHVICLFD